MIEGFKATLNGGELIAMIQDEVKSRKANPPERRRSTAIRKIKVLEFMASHLNAGEIYLLDEYEVERFLDTLEEEE